VVLARGGHREQMSIGLELEGGRAQLRNLDRDVQTRLLKVARPPRNVYFVTGHGERTFDPVGDTDKRAIADELAAYTGIPAEYFLSHGLTIAKQEFNRQLLPGKLLNANDTRIAVPLPPPPKNQQEAQKQQSGDLLDPLHRIYTDYMRQELKVDLPGSDYQIMAPKSFESWDWGSGCNDYLLSAGLCNPDSKLPSIFMDYDYPEVLKRQFADPQFRAMIIAGYYDGLSSIGTHRYLVAQLGFPKDRFSLHEYAGGHMTAGDPKAQPLVMADVRAFLLAGRY